MTPRHSAERDFGAQPAGATLRGLAGGRRHKPHLPRIDHPEALCAETARLIAEAVGNGAAEIELVSGWLEELGKERGGREPFQIRLQRPARIRANPRKATQKASRTATCGQRSTTRASYQKTF